MKIHRAVRKYCGAAVLFAGACLLLAAGVQQADAGEERDHGIPRLEITLQDITLEELQAGDKSVRYGGSQVTVIDPAKGNRYTDSDVEIRGRGNSSWKMPKRSYQLRFGQKTSMPGLGEGKKWLLIANYADASLMRNKLMYDMAGQLMDFAPDSCFVDLWIDEEYQGNYLLCEKVEIGEGRVDLKDDRGLLAEMDNIYYYQEEKTFQSQYSGSYFALKDVKNEVYAEEAFAEFQYFLNEFERLLYEEEKDWEQIASMIDVDSFVKYYYMEELAENSDSCRTSVYLYKDGPEDVLHMGPVWDFDKALGYSMRGKFGGDTQRDYVKNIEEYMGTGKDNTWYAQLFSIPEFCLEAERIYQKQIGEVFRGAGELIDGYREEIAKSAETNFQRWEISDIPATCDHEPYAYTEWKEAVDGLQHWIEERVEYLDKKPLPS